MDAATERLFGIIQEGIGAEMPDKEIISQIKADESLISASGSYCNRCGSCCDNCANLDLDEVASCLLHDEVYPNGKKIPDFGFAKDFRLDENKWAKPSVCHTYGPHLGLLYSLRTGRLPFCPGGEKMEREYMEFLDNRI
jgi:hypothetical protein